MKIIYPKRDLLLVLGWGKDGGLFELTYYMCTFCSLIVSHINNENVYPCSQCQFARYCSEECQQKHWVKTHKYECKPCKDPHALIRRESSILLLKDLLACCTGVKIFHALKPSKEDKKKYYIDCSDLVASPQDRIDLSSVVRFFTRRNAIPYIDLDSVEECEQLIARSLTIILGALPVSYSNPLPRMLACDSKAFLNDPVFVEHPTYPNQFFVGLGINFFATDDAVQWAKLQFDTKGPPPFPVANDSLRLAKRIEWDPAYRPCRQWIRKYKKDNRLGQCVVLVRNLFKSAHDAFYRRDLKRVTPTPLLEALRRQDGSVSIQEPCMIDDPIVISILDHHVEEPSRLGFLKSSIITGIFSTYLHSQTNISLNVRFSVAPTDEIDVQGDELCKDAWFMK